MKTKELMLKVNCVTDYINIIKNKNLLDYYFRGENEYFPKINSSLIRSYVPTMHNGSLTEIYTELIKEYYQEIGNDIAEIQRNNFVSFAQHHGLKTNLIDFTTAPLVALYFACERDTYLEKTTGYVHLINKEATIDASDVLGTICRPEVKNHNIFSLYANKNYTVINEIKNMLNWHCSFLNDKGHSPNETLHKLVKQISARTDIFITCNEYINQINEIYKKQYENLEGIDPREEFDLINRYLPKLEKRGLQNITRYCVLLYILFEDINTVWFQNSKSLLNIEFPNIPYFIYKTPLKFDRIKNQSGVFLYQGFYDYEKTEGDGFHGIAVQEIKPNLSLIINNQREILNELDMVGINKKLIYGDFDNIARYTNKMFFE